MKIKLSKSQWENIGLKAGWKKVEAKSKEDYKNLKKEDKEFDDDEKKNKKSKEKFLSKRKDKKDKE